MIGLQFAESVALDGDHQNGIDARQLIVADYARRIIKGLPAPTLEELCAVTGLYSRSTVRQHLDILWRRKVLTKIARRYSLRVLKYEPCVMPALVFPK